MRKPSSPKGEAFGKTGRTEVGRPTSLHSRVAAAASPAMGRRRARAIVCSICGAGIVCFTASASRTARFRAFWTMWVTLAPRRPVPSRLSRHSFVLELFQCGNKCCKGAGVVAEVMLR